jgi:hypothetical protein
VASAAGLFHGLPTVIVGAASGVALILHHNFVPRVSEVSEVSEIPPPLFLPLPHPSIFNNSTNAEGRARGKIYGGGKPLTSLTPLTGRCCPIPPAGPHKNLRADRRRPISGRRRALSRWPALPNPAQTVLVVILTTEKA